MIDSLRNKTFGAFILVENEFSMKLVMEELKRKDTKSTFNLIMSGTNIDNIIEIINEKFIDRVCIFSSSSKKYDSLKNKYPIIKGIFTEEKEVQDFIKEYPEDYEDRVHLQVRNISSSPSFVIKFDEHPNDIESIQRYAVLYSFRNSV